MKKQSYIYYLFWALLLIQIILTIMIWSVTGNDSSPCHFSRDESLLSILLKVSLSITPLINLPQNPYLSFVGCGLGTSLNPQNPLGYKLSLLVVMGVLVLLFCLTLLAFLGK